VFLAAQILVFPTVSSLLFCILTKLLLEGRESRQIPEGIWRESSLSCHPKEKPSVFPFEFAFPNLSITQERKKLVENKTFPLRVCVS